MVDNSHINGELLSEYLDNPKLTLIQAKSAEEALEKVSEEEPHLVITSVGLPGMSAVDLRRKLQETHTHLPVVLLTATIGDDFYEDLFSAVLQKPLRQEETLSCLAALLQCTELQESEVFIDESSTLHAGSYSIDKAPELIEALNIMRQDEQWLQTCKEMAIGDIQKVISCLHTMAAEYENDLLKSWTDKLEELFKEFDMKNLKTEFQNLNEHIKLQEEHYLKMQNVNQPADVAISLSEE